MKVSFKTKPYAHQRQALRFLWSNHGGGLLMEPGTGKTKVAIDYCSALEQASHKLRRILVVAPLGVLGVWEDELKKHFLGDYRVLRLPKTSRQKTKVMKEFFCSPETCPAFLLINYESCWRMDAILLNWSPQIVIADESHQIKHHGARKSKSLHKFAKLSPEPRRLILTGTPVTNSPLDIFSQWKFLNPHRFGTKWSDFRFYYARYGGYGGHEILGYENLDQLAARVKEDSFAITKAECLDLPPATDSIIRIAMEDKTAAAYDDMSHDLVAFIEGATEPVTAAIVLTKLLRLSQITGGFAKTDDGECVEVGSEKQEALSDLLDSLDDRPVVIFCRFLWEIERCAQIAHDLGRSVGRITGRVDPTWRDHEVKSFRKGLLDTLICQIATGGLGIDLSAAQYAIFYSLDYSSDHYIQARDRLHRIGQQNKVTYYHLVMKGTIDRHILTALKNHKKVSELILAHPQVLVRKSSNP